MMRTLSVGALHTYYSTFDYVITNLTLSITIEWDHTRHILLIVQYLFFTTKRRDIMILNIFKKMIIQIMMLFWKRKYKNWSMIIFRKDVKSSHFQYWWRIFENTEKKKEKKMMKVVRLIWYRKVQYYLKNND